MKLTAASALSQQRGKHPQSKLGKPTHLLPTWYQEHGLAHRISVTHEFSIGLFHQKARLKTSGIGTSTKSGYQVEDYSCLCQHCRQRNNHPTQINGNSVGPRFHP